MVSTTNSSKTKAIVNEEGLAFDDVLLVPQYSEILPSDVILTSQLTKKIQLKTPILSAAMDTVTESHMAITIAGEGGIGIIHKNMSIDEQARQIRIVKKFESGIINDPVTATPSMTVKQINDITEKYLKFIESRRNDAVKTEQEQARKQLEINEPSLTIN